MSGYISFVYTGNPLIDAILSAVEDAGTAYHHTSQWADDGYDGQPSCIEAIEKAAQEAAAAWNTRQAQAQGSEVQAEVVGKVRQRRGVHGDFDGFEVEWLLEGGIHAIGVDGETFLYVIDGVPVPDDGALTLYTANVGSGGSDNAAHAQAGEGSNG